MSLTYVYYLFIFFLLNHLIVKRLRKIPEVGENLIEVYGGTRLFLDSGYSI
jgi:hypothetical protein